MKCASKKQQLESDLRRYVQSATTNFSAVDFRKRLADWPVYALAAGSALALPNAAVADVIHSPGLPLTAASNLFLGSNFVTTGLKLTNRTGKDLLASLDVSLRLGFRTVPPLTSVFSSATARVKGNRLQFLGEGGSANLLASGAKVSSGAPGTFQSGNNLLRLKTFNKTFTSPSHLQQSGNATAGNWPSNGAGFVGFRFSTNGQVDYGYADIAVASEGGFPDSVSLLCAAYDDTGAAITTAAGCPGSTSTGTVPEPSNLALALLATGSIGVLALRRRKALATRPNGDS